MTQFEFPALYRAADSSSATAQVSYLRLIKGEYAFLITCAILSMNFSNAPAYHLLYAVILMSALGIAVARNSTKPEQGWYRSRALAESVKTSAWRFCMRAEPFGDSDSLVRIKAEFRDHLLEILQANRFMGDRISADETAGAPIPESMITTRSLSLDDRKSYYRELRIREQRTWYAKKAKKNKEASTFWFRVVVGSYSLAIILSVSRIAYPDWKFWPIDAILVFASAILGWTQVKRFNELASSYSLTAHEIGILQGRLDGISSEPDFSDFVNDSEQAFSREHTQWVARQQSS